MFDIGEFLYLLFFSPFFLEKKSIYILYLLSISYGFFLWIKSNFFFCSLKPRMDWWSLSANEKRNKWTRSLFRMLLWSSSSREENKMLLSLPLSFPALLIFSSNAGGGGRGRKKPKIRALLSDFFFSATQESALFLSAGFQIFYWTHGIARTLQIMFEPMFKPNPLPIWVRLERMPASDKRMLSLTIKGKARRREGEGKGGSM